MEIKFKWWILDNREYFGQKPPSDFKAKFIYDQYF